MPQPPTLDYSPPPPPRRRIPWLVLLGLAAVIGVIYWSLSDFWAYVGTGAGGAMVPKFQMPLWWQVMESSVVGLGATAILYGLFRLGRWWLG